MEGQGRLLYSPSTGHVGGSDQVVIEMEKGGRVVAVLEGNDL